MSGLLVGFNGRQLLHITVVSGGSSGSCQLTLVGQSGNLVGHPFHDQFFVVVVICRERAEHILLKRECRGIPMMPSHGCCPIKAALKGFLDQSAKHGPGLGGWWQAIPFLKRPDVQAGSQEETDLMGFVPEAQPQHNLQYAKKVLPVRWLLNTGHGK
jgi:hypothetical protein